MNKNIARMMMHISRLSQSYIADLMTPFGLTAAEQPFFMAMIAREGVTQEELSSLVGVHKAAATRAVRTLEEKGFLIREQNSDDRRQNRIYPTEKARNIYPQVQEALFRFDTLLLNGVDDGTQAEISEALSVMEANLENGKKGKTE